MHRLDAAREQVAGLYRIVVGFLFACHGFKTVFGMFGAKAPLAVVGRIPELARLTELGNKVRAGEHDTPARVAASAAFSRPRPSIAVVRSGRLGNRRRKP